MLKMRSFVPFVLLALWLTKRADVGMVEDLPGEVAPKRKVTVKELCSISLTAAPAVMLKMRQ